MKHSQLCFKETQTAVCGKIIRGTSPHPGWKHHRESPPPNLVHRSRRELSLNYGSTLPTRNSVLTLPAPGGIPYGPYDPHTCGSFRSPAQLHVLKNTTLSLWQVHLASSLDSLQVLTCKGLDSLRLDAPRLDPLHLAHRCRHVARRCRVRLDPPYTCRCTFRCSSDSWAWSRIKS